MRLDALTEIWILDVTGTTHFHFPQSISIEKSGLLHKFLAGILNFMSEMGGKNVYQLSLAQSTIIGLKLTQKESAQKYFIVGAFVGDKQKKYLKQLKVIQKELELESKCCDFEGKSPQLAQLIQKFL